MPYRITLADGTSIDCDTRKELLDLLEDLKVRGFVATALDPDEKAPDELNPWVLLEQALAAVAESGEAGISSGELAKWIGLDGPNSMGPKGRVWRRLFRSELGIPFDSVWEHREISRGHRRWFAGDRIQEALQLVSRRAASADRE